jgi:hypothetical protein
LIGSLRENTTVFHDYWTSNLKRIQENGYGNMIDEHVASYELILSNMNKRDIPIYFLRFEDFKKNPLTTMLNTLSVIGITREISCIRDALAMSSVDRALDANVRGGGEKVIYSGEVYEYRSNKPWDVEYKLLREAMDPIFCFFGYD